MIFSVTDLSSYDYCKRKFYLQKKYNLKEPLKPSLIIGKIKHSTFEDFSKKEKEILIKIKRTFEEAQIQKLFYEEYLKLFKNNILKNKEKIFDFNLSIEEVYENNKKVFLADSKLRTKIVLETKKQGYYEETLYENLNPKIISEEKIIVEKLKLKGIIDRIILEEKEDKKIITIYEFKSGKTPKEVWPSHKIQINSYLAMLKEKTKNEKNILIKEGIVNYIDKEKEFKIKYNPFIKIEVQKKVEEIEKTLKGKLPEKTLNKNKCNICGLKKICYDEKKLKELEMEEK